MNITEMQEKHLSALAELEKQCFHAPWSEKMLREELGSGLFLVAERAGEVCGYVGCQTVLDEGYITNVAVFPSCRRQGIANALFDAYLAAAGGQKSLVWARIGNEAAERFYETHDYRPDGWNSVVLQYGGTEQ